MMYWTLSLAECEVQGIPSRSLRSP